MKSAEKRNSSCNGWKLQLGKVKLEKMGLLPAQSVCVCVHVFAAGRAEAGESSEFLA